MNNKYNKTFLYILTSIVFVFALALSSCAPDSVEEPSPTVEETEPMEEAEPTEEESETMEEEASPTEEETEPAEEMAEEAAVETFRAGILGDESTLNPFTYVTGDPGWNILMMQYDSLFTLDMEGQPQPWLVQEWSLSEDSLTYTLNLREDVSWNDGEKFTAEDVKFTFDYLTENPVGRFARDIRGYVSSEVVSDYQVTITLEAPNPGYVRQAFADVPMLPEHVWKDVSDPENHQFESVTNVGTGPYKLMEYEPQQFYQFQANHDYFAGQPTVEELVLVQFADDAGAQAAFRTNEVDMLFRPISPEQVTLLEGIEGVTITKGPQFTTQMVMFNYDVEPFGQNAVRKALAYSIDRQTLVDTIYLGFATKGSYGWIHPNSPLYNEDVESIYDVELAKELLGEAGIEDTDGDGVREYEGSDMSFELITPNNNALRLRIAELLKEMFAEIGVAVEVASVEQTTWEEAVWPGFDVTNGRSYEMTMWGWSAPVQADAFRVPELVHSSSDIGFLNLSGVSNETIDALSEEMMAETNHEERVELLKQLQVEIADEIPFAVLLYPDGIYAYWSSVYDGLAFRKGQGMVHKFSFLPEDARP